MTHFTLRSVKTWHIEAAFVFVVLIATVLFVGAPFKEWVGAAAVFFSFMHAQVADRMAGKQAQMEMPSVACYPFSHRYYLLKEGLWIFYFILSGTWTALVGGFVFLLYPFWRKFYAQRFKDSRPAGP